MTNSEQIDGLVAAARGESVTTETLQRTIGERALSDHLTDSEQPHFLLRGSMLDIVDLTVSDDESGRRSRKVAGSGSALFTVVTDERLLVLIPRSGGTEQLAVSLGDIESAETERAPGGNRRLSIESVDTAYRIDTSQSPGDETDAASAFIDNSETTSSRDSDDDPLATLERLADLRERGHLSQQEFEEKKGELLDRI